MSKRRRHSACDEKSTPPADSSFESCIVLLEDLSELLRNLRQRDKFQSPLPPSELRNFSVASDLIPKELDQKSGNLLRILGEIQQEWDETIRKITPISPFTNQISFLEGEY
ncbi:unnamed protein product [Schistosoma mattheei]|uniref:Uncharacterized protein n=1 Tax=Schistosoma mattheei TaxID=31246 RepID=A0A183NZM2_9TREM|nr:unnamed protein product [Schistosoma mattheei]